MMNDGAVPGPADETPRPGDDHRPHHHAPPRLSDVDAYRLLLRLGHTAQHLALRCWSTAAATALIAAAQTLRTLASALYRANIRD
jgi:hypothetical protein